MSEEERIFNRRPKNVTRINTTGHVSGRRYGYEPQCDINLIGEKGKTLRVIPGKFVPKWEYIPIVNTLNEVIGRLNKSSPIF